MKIAHISFSRSGGAGRVAQMLSTEMVKMGHDSIFVYTANTSLVRNFYRNPIILISAIIDNYLIKSRTSFSLFSILRARTNLKHDLKKFDVIHLHWTPGIFSFSDLVVLSQLGKKVIWTLHDMWPFTGGCHHSFGCTQYRSSCVSCPQVNQLFKKTIKKNFISKYNLLDANLKLSITAPSSWLLENSKKSKLFGNLDHSMICNPIEATWFNSKIDANRILEVHKGTRKLVIGFSAINANLESKGIYEFMHSFNLKKSEGFIDFNFEFLIIGEFSKANSHSNLSVTGKILNTPDLIDEYRKMDILVNPSLSENSPMNIIEAGALGIPSISRRVGGMAELVEDGVSGYTFDTVEESIEKIYKLIDINSYSKASKNAQSIMLNKHSIEKVSQKFVTLYSN
jgi:glycosyltransferase involved in cell wall biosynthesis